MENTIAATSELYEELLKAYDIKDKRARFDACYQIVDKAEYSEIHYVISMLKEFENTGDTSSIPIEKIEHILKTVTTLFAGKEAGRRAYLLDILEEARDRKRP